MWARGRHRRSPWPPPLFAWPCSPLTRPPSPARSRVSEQTPPDAGNGAQALLVKPDFIGGAPCAPPSTRVARRQGRRVRLGRPAPQAPPPRRRGAARTAHRLPRRRRRRLRRRHPLQGAARTPGAAGFAAVAPRRAERTTSGEGGGGGGALTSRAAAIHARAGGRREAVGGPIGRNSGWVGGPLQLTGRSIGPGGGASRRAGE